MPGIVTCKSIINTEDILQVGNPIPARCKSEMVIPWLVSLRIPCGITVFNCFFHQENMGLPRIGGGENHGLPSCPCFDCHTWMVNIPHILEKNATLPKYHVLGSHRVPRLSPGAGLGFQRFPKILKQKWKSSGNHHRHHHHHHHHHHQNSNSVSICVNMCQYVSICVNMWQYVSICVNMCYHYTLTIWYVYTIIYIYIWVYIYVCDSCNMLQYVTIIVITITMRITPIIIRQYYPIYWDRTQVWNHQPENCSSVC